MSDPSSRNADGSSLWQAVRDFLNLRTPGTLRESIEEAIEEHRDDDGDDPEDLDASERVMLRNILNLSDRKVGEISVPRSDIIAVDESSDFDTIVATFREAGHSRLPLYRQSLDEVIGMLLIKDVYAILAESHGGAPVASPPLAAALMRPVLFVPPSMPVIDLLTDMRRKRTHMAIVVDEYGGTDGLVTIEDIVEEIVGEIEDEHDEEETRLLTLLDDGTYLADARIPLRMLDEETGARFEDADAGYDVDTLGGLVFLIAGKVPSVGETLVHPNGWSMDVVASDGRRIERLLLRAPAAEGEAPSMENGSA